MARSYPQHRFALPPDATELMLVRHGASEPAIPGEPFPLVDGHADPPLDSPGVDQAMAVCERLAAPAADEIHAVFHSDLTRTRQTAAPLAEALGLEARALPALREVFLGDWEGGEFRIRMHDGDPVAMRALAEERWDVIPNAEAPEALAARVRAGIEEAVAQTGPGRRAAVFVHGGIIGEVAREATASRPFAFVHAENCSVSRLVVFGDGRWLLRSFNETSHLDES
jgi:probable phosphoglycerate mutase